MIQTIGQEPHTASKNDLRPDSESTAIMNYSHLGIKTNDNKIKVLMNHRVILGRLFRCSPIIDRVKNTKINCSI